MPCICEKCTHLHVWPEMPYMDPPAIADADRDPASEWTVACHWMGPLIDGTATLIQRGFRTDGGSIPRPFWPVVGHPFQMPLLPHFLEHDAGYAAELRRRAVCDARLYRGAELDGHISLIKRRIIFRAVRLGGGSAWSDHKPESIALNRRLCRIVGEEEYFALQQSRCVPPLPAQQPNSLNPLIP